MSLNKYIISKPYSIDVNSIKYDTKICNFNTRRTNDSVERLADQINLNGQTQPALMRNNMLGDGVHRAMACKLLGIQLLVIDIDPDISDADYLLMCNESTFTARNLSLTQLAIKAYKMVKEFGFTDTSACKKTGCRDPRLLGYARYLNDSQYARENMILDSLEKGEKIQVNGKYTKSLDVAKRLVKGYEEEMRLGVSVTLNNIMSDADYDSKINSEADKVIFWEMINTTSKIEQRLQIIQLLNNINELKEEIAKVKR